MPDGFNPRQHTRAVLEIAAELIQHGEERGIDLEVVWRIPQVFAEAPGFDQAALAQELGLPRRVSLRTEIQFLPKGGPQEG